jgi:hypothetical protein
MTDLVKLTQELPTQPTSADTADWYRLGDAVEKHGRHMKRQAVAAEYNSGRNMEAWYREINLNSQTGREILMEARGVGLLDMSNSSEAQKLSEALPTARAAREYAKAEPEVREVIKEIIKEDPDKEIKAAEIRRLRKENDELIRRVGAAETNNIRETVIDSSIIASSAGLLSDLASGMVDEYFHERLQPAQQQRLLQTLQDIVNYSESFIERNSIQNITTQIIDVEF